MEINAKEARSNLGMLLDRVEEGDEILIFRRGKKVARLAGVQGKIKRLPSLKDFRSRIKIKGTRLSAVIRGDREEARY